MTRYHSKWIALIVLGTALLFSGNVFAQPADTFPCSCEKRSQEEIDLQLEQIRQLVETNKYSFTVGYSPAMDYNVCCITGFRPEEGFKREFEIKQHGEPTRAVPDLPRHFDWREHNGGTPVRAQGNHMNCWAFATVAPLESQIKLKCGIEVDLSEQYLVANNLEGWGHSTGGWYAHDYHLWKHASWESEAGAVLERDCPYDGVSMPCTHCPHPHGWFIDDWSLVGELGVLPSVQQLKEAIYTHGPVGAGVAVGDFFMAYRDGVFDCNEFPDSYVNHLVTLVGWDDDYYGDGSNVGVWILKNSWSPWWGDQGYMYIKYGISMVGVDAAYIEFSKCPEPGRYSLTARAYIDYRCDGVFKSGVDAPLKEIPITLSFPDSPRLRQWTGSTGNTYFYGFGVPEEGVQISADLPEEYEGYVLKLCSNNAQIVRLRPEDFGPFRFKYLEFRAQLVKENHHTITLDSAVINGRDITEARTIYVDPGSSLTGKIQVTVHNPDRPQAIVPLAATASWKWNGFVSNSQTFTELDDWVPPGDHSYTYTLPDRLTAPLDPGTYYVGIFHGSVYTTEELMSCDGFPFENRYHWDTDWEQTPEDMKTEWPGTRAATDVADWSWDLWEKAVTDDHVDGFPFCHETYCGCGCYGAAAIRVIVGPEIPEAPEGRYTLSARAYIDYRCDGFFKDGVDIPLESIRIGLTFPNNATLWSSTGKSGSAYLYGFDVPEQGITAAAYIPTWYWWNRGDPIMLEPCPNSPQSIDLKPGDFGPFDYKFLQFRARIVD